MFIKLWKKALEKDFQKKRYPFLGQLLAPYLGEFEKILDVGSASGALAKHIYNISPNKNFEIEGVDVVVPEKTHIPVTKYDGKKLPFADNSFDCVLIVDILHHDENPENIIQEAVRVSKGVVLIKDHYWDNKFDFWILSVFDYIGNKPFGIPLAYNFLKMETWEKMFSSQQLIISEVKTFKEHKTDLRKNVLFKIKKISV